MPIAEMLAEVDEMLERIVTGLAQVEKSEHTSDLLNSIYRDMHTIKGSAQLFGCEQISQLAHAMETCLDPVRRGDVVLSGTLVDALYLGIDLIRKLVEGLKHDHREIDVQQEILHLIPALADIVSGMVAPLTSPLKDVPGLPEDTASEVAAISLVTAAADRSENIQPANQIYSPVKGSVSMQHDSQSETDRQGDAQQKANAKAAGESIRVQVGLLDSLMNLVGELVLIRNQVIQYTNLKAEEPEFVNLSQRLNIVTTELQNEVMKTRMQPIGNILSKFHRIVRDVSRELGKEIELTLEGTETELDKTLIEAVKDPLTHIVRNSVDHGIEMPNARREAGKTAVGQILLRSFHEGGQVVVEVVDDGAGLNRKRIGEKAVSKGLVTKEALEKMSDREVNHLIFLPGFSTAEKVTNISGRGVGMDVVRTNIEKIGGVVDINSTEGSGMTIRLKIPLTLAIVPALIVQSGTHRFAIPQVKLVELVRIENIDNGSGNEIQLLQGQPVFRLRGSLLPLVSLNELLGMNGKVVSDISEYRRTGGTNIAVLNADSGQFGLIVDSIEDSTDIVVKPLSAFLKNLGVYSGATVLGDGSVALVLDVIGLATHANIFDDKALETQGSKGRHIESQATSDIAEYLIVDIGAPGRYGIPLCIVNRLEEFRTTDLERAGDQLVVRYRGTILPVLSIAKNLALHEEAKADKNRDPESINVVVIERDGRNFGLIVNSIIDVTAIDAPLDTQLRDRPSILGTTYHADGVVVIIDAFKIIDQMAHVGGDEPALDTSSGSQNRARGLHRVLLVEDNAFFRKHIQQILTGAGFKVTADVNGEDAYKRLQTSEGSEFSLLLSDIEMPRMNGLSLAEKVRAKSDFAKLPLVALTTKNSREDIETGLRSGFNKYLKKLDGDQLIRELDESLGLSKERKYGT